MFYLLSIFTRVLIYRYINLLYKLLLCITVLRVDSFYYKWVQVFFHSTRKRSKWFAELKKKKKNLHTKRV